MEQENVPSQEGPVAGVQENRTDAIVKDLRINSEWVITLLFCLFLGVFGVHRFYNGKIGTGILMLVTFGGLGIWVTIDLIFILVGKFAKKDGAPISIRV